MSLPFEIGCHVALGVVWVTFGKGIFDSVRRLMVVSEALQRILALPQFDWAHHLIRMEADFPVLGTNPSNFGLNTEK